MDDRKKRLAALRAKAGRMPASNDDTESDKPTEQSVHEEEDESPAVTEPSRPGKDQHQNQQKSALQEALEKAKKDLELGGVAQIDPSSTNGNVPAISTNTELTSMAPKKVNWDLKRNIQPKLDKLEKRTQKAIVQLLRERLAMEVDARDDDGIAEDLD